MRNAVIGHALGREQDHLAFTCDGLRRRTGSRQRFQDLPLRRLEPERGRWSKHAPLDHIRHTIVNNYDGQDTSIVRLASAAGTASRKHRAALEAYLRDVVQGSVPILPYDAAAASWHGQE